MDKWKIGDKYERIAHAKMSIEKLDDPKIEEKNLQSVIAPAMHSTNK